MCVCAFFSPGLSEQMDMYPKNLMVNQCSASFSPSKDIVCPLNSTILRMPNSCERINQRMPHFSHQDFLFRAKFQKATEVSASDDELKVPFWEWVYSFKDLNMCIHIYIYILSLLLRLLLLLLYYITFSQWTFIWDGFKPPASLAKKFGLSQFAQSFQEVTSRGVPKCGLLRLIPAISTWYPSTPVWCQKRLTSPCKSKDSTTVTIVPHIFTCQPPTAPCQQKNEREIYIYIQSVDRHP